MMNRNIAQVISSVESTLASLPSREQVVARRLISDASTSIPDGTDKSTTYCDETLLPESRDVTRETSYDCEDDILSSITYENRESLSPKGNEGRVPSLSRTPNSGSHIACAKMDSLTSTICTKPSKVSNYGEAMRNVSYEAGNPPKRPVSAYNLFFQMERQRIIDACYRGEIHRTLGEYDASNPLVHYSVEDIESFTSHQKRIVKIEKRKHRKTHPKIKFLELAKIISRRWKAMHEAERAVFQEHCAGEAIQYRLDYARWKELQEKGSCNSIIEKNASIEPSSPIARNILPTTRTKAATVGGLGLKYINSVEDGSSPIVDHAYQHSMFPSTRALSHDKINPKKDNHRHCQKYSFMRQGPSPLPMSNAALDQYISDEISEQRHPTIQHQTPTAAPSFVADDLNIHLDRLQQELFAQQEALMKQRELIEQKILAIQKEEGHFSFDDYYQSTRRETSSSFNAPSVGSFLNAPLQKGINHKDPVFLAGLQFGAALVRTSGPLNNRVSTAPSLVQLLSGSTFDNTCNSNQVTRPASFPISSMPNLCMGSDPVARNTNEHSEQNIMYIDDEDHHNAGVYASFGQHEYDDISLGYLQQVADQSMQQVASIMHLQEDDSFSLLS